MPVGFVLGIVIYFHLKSEPDYRQAVLVTLVTWVLAWAVRRRNMYVALAGLAVAFTASGFTICALRSHWLTMPLITEATPPMRISGRVIMMEERDYGKRVTLDHLWYNGRPDPNMPDSLRLTARKGMVDGFRVGDWMRALAIATPIPAPYYPGGFDYQRYLFFIGIKSGIGGTGFILKPAYHMHAPRSYRNDFLIRVQLMRAAIADRVNRVLDGDRAAIATALIAGNQSYISREALDAMRNSGLAHILSISGLHIGMMALITLVLLRAGMALMPRLALNYNIKIWALAAAIGPVTFYSILAGLDQVPVLRSWVMAVIALMTLLLGRRNFSMRVVGIAALICMLAFPDQLLGASLQMSFAAVIALMALGQSQFMYNFIQKSRDYNWLRRGVMWVAAALLTSVVATLATSPSAIYSFNREAIYGAIANLLVIPATDFIMVPCVALSLVLMPFGLEYWVLKLFGASIDYMLAVAKWTSSLPGAVFSLPPIGDNAFLAMMLGGLFICLGAGKWRWLGVVPVLAGVVVVAVTPLPDLVIEQNGKLIALRHPVAGTVFSRHRVSPNMVTAINAVFFRERGANFPQLSENPGSGVHCENDVCEIDLFPTRIIWVAKPNGFDTICPSKPDHSAPDKFMTTKPVLLITPLPRAGNCPVTWTIWDKEFLTRAGATSLWLQATPYRFTTVAAVRGVRPWVVRPSDADEGE